MSTGSLIGQNGTGDGQGGQGQTQMSWDALYALLNPPALAQDTSASVSSDPEPAESSTAPAASPTPAGTAPGSVNSSTVNALLASQPQPPTLQSVPPPFSAASDPTVSADVAAEHDALKKYESDSASSQSKLDQLTQAEIDTLQEQPSAPPQQQTNPLSRIAPLLMISALGGKASKMDAGLMLAATNGTIQGYLQGNQQKMEEGQKQYEQAYQQFKDRQAAQLKIYETLKDAYAGRPDADLKALQMAHNMTGDDMKVDQDRATAQEHYVAAANKLAEDQYKMQNEQWTERAKLKVADQKAAVAGEKNAPLTAEQIEPLAQQIATYKAPMPTLSGFALRNPQSVKAIADLTARVKTINPDYNQQQYGVSQKARTSFTTGRQGDTVRSFNVLVNHLDTLQHLMNALNNGDPRAINLAANEVSRQLGVAAPVKFDAARRVVADEITKAVTGSAGALGDRQELQKNLSEGNSPSAMSGVIDTYKDLAGGQLYGLQQQYEAGTKSTTFAQDMHLSPAAQALLQRATETSSTKAGNAPATGTISKGYRFKGGDPADPKNWEKVGG